MPHYYVDFDNPPPFAATLTGAIGYLSTWGIKVLYGRRDVPFIGKPLDSLRMRLAVDESPRLKQADGPHNWQPHPSVIAPKVLAKMKKEYLKPKDFSIPKGSLKKCEICEVPQKITLHHVTPKHIRRTKSVPFRGVRYVCRPCHTEIHKIFSHEELVAMDWEEVVRFMKTTL